MTALLDNDLAAKAFAAGQAAWPEVTLDPDRFAAHLAAVGASSTAGAAHLYLATACGEGDPHALRHFDKILSLAVETVLAGRGYSASEQCEVMQRLRVKLLTAEADRPPRILEYSGRGDLAAWVRVAALRHALNMRRETVREEELEDGGLLEACACTGHSQEAAHVAIESRDAFVSVFQAAFRSLSTRERNLLRLHYLDGVELQDLAAAYSVHRVTVGRWLEVARDRLRKEVERCLVVQLDVAESEAARLVYSVRRAADLSLQQLLPVSGG